MRISDWSSDVCSSDLHEGVEAALEFQAAEWLRLRQVYTYSNFRFRGDAQFGDNRLPVVPKHVYRTELRIGSDALHVALNLEWVTEGPFADYRNQFSKPVFALSGVPDGGTIVGGTGPFVMVL